MKRTLLITALALSMAVPAFAQQSGQQSQKAQAQGTVDSYRIVAIEGEPDGHVLVRITPTRTQRGQDTFTYIDLGPARQLEDRNVNIGADQDLVAIGYLGRINGVPILVAERFELEGQRFALQDQRRQTARQDQRRQFQQGADAPVHLVRGEVEAIKDFSIKGIKNDHRLIKVSDAERPDRTWVVDLGDTNKLQQLDLKKGDRVLVQGRSARIEGKPVLRATQLAEVVTLDENLERFQDQRAQQLRNQAQQSARAQQQQESR